MAHARVTLDDRALRIGLEWLDHGGESTRGPEIVDVEKANDRTSGDFDADVRTVAGPQFWWRRTLAAQDPQRLDHRGRFVVYPSSTTMISSGSCPCTRILCTDSRKNF